ncbi:hypothetical protein NMY22_g15300 [Coprinellus aureogranulatus]|nr:hypothetical protein NMY22_g15300 [Coprinellus aureogranulatus]
MKKRGIRVEPSSIHAWQAAERADSLHYAQQQFTSNPLLCHPSHFKPSISIPWRPHSRGACSVRTEDGAAAPYAPLCVFPPSPRLSFTVPWTGPPVHPYAVTIPAIEIALLRNLPCTPPFLLTSAYTPRHHWGMRRPSAESKKTSLPVALQAAGQNVKDAGGGVGCEPVESEGTECVYLLPSSLLASPIPVSYQGLLPPSTLTSPHPAPHSPGFFPISYESRSQRRLPSRTSTQLPGISDDCRTFHSIFQQPAPTSSQSLLDEETVAPVPSRRITRRDPVLLHPQPLQLDKRRGTVEEHHGPQAATAWDRDSPSLTLCQSYPTKSYPVPQGFSRPPMHRRFPICKASQCSSNGSSIKESHHLRLSSISLVQMLTSSDRSCFESPRLAKGGPPFQASASQLSGRGDLCVYTKR